VNEKKFQVADNASWKKMDDLIIVVNLDTGAYYSLNRTASEIWENLASGKTIEEITAHLADTFDTADISEEKLETDISGSIDEWLAENLIVGG
jgi:hypothetical protein